MKPRVFISSTYYDLKYVRENMLRFVEDRYEFDAVLFERGNIPYYHDKSMSESCYTEVDRCNMMILIIGGKYGTIDNNDSDPLVSITQREFKTAVKKNIPIFIFIDKNVYLEYEIYKNNNNLTEYNPVYVDNIKIFEFIDELKSQPIKCFEKMEDIEIYLSEQWSGWFYNYLDNLGNKSYEHLNDKLTNTLEVVEKLKSIIDTMANQTLEKEQIDLIRDNETKMDIKYYSTRVLYCIVFEKFKLDSENTAKDFSQLFFECFYYNGDVINYFNNIFQNRFDYFEELIKDFNCKLKNVSESITIKTIDFSKLFQGNEKIIDKILEENNSQYFIECLSKELKEFGE